MDNFKARTQTFFEDNSDSISFVSFSIIIALVFCLSNFIENYIEIKNISACYLTVSYGLLAYILKKKNIRFIALALFAFPFISLINHIDIYNISKLDHNILFEIVLDFLELCFLLFLVHKRIHLEKMQTEQQLYITKNIIPFFVVSFVFRFFGFLFGYTFLGINFVDYDNTLVKIFSLDHVVGILLGLDICFQLNRMYIYKRYKVVLLKLFSIFMCSFLGYFAIVKLNFMLNMTGNIIAYNTLVLTTILVYLHAFQIDNDYIGTIKKNIILPMFFILFIISAILNSLIENEKNKVISIRFDANFQEFKRELAHLEESTEKAINATSLLISNEKHNANDEKILSLLQNQNKYLSGLWFVKNNTIEKKWIVDTRNNGEELCEEGRESLLAIKKIVSEKLPNGSKRSVEVKCTNEISKILIAHIKSPQEQIYFLFDFSKFIVDYNKRARFALEVSSDISKKQPYQILTFKAFDLFWQTPEKIVNDSVKETIIVVAFIVKFILVGVVIVFLFVFQQFITLRNIIKLSNEKTIKLQNYLDTKNKFLSNLSHDFRTPLNGVVATIDLMKQDDRLIEHSDTINMLDKCSSQMFLLVKDFLDFARLEIEHETDVEKSVFDLNETLQGVAVYFNTEQSIVKLIHPEDSKSNLLYIEADLNKFRQVLMSVITSLIKLYEVEEVQISNNYKVLDKQNGTIELHIEIISHRPKSSLGSVNQGLENDFENSLIIAQSLCSKLGAEIVFEKKSELVTNIRFSLVTKKMNYFSYKKLGVAVDVKHKKIRVLIVDDNEINLKVMQGILSKVSIVPELAKDGQEGLAMYSQHNYDLIFMDLQMPIMDGYEATRQIRKLDKGVRPIIVALTAEAFDQNRELALRAGMDDFVTKPIKLDDIKNVIGKYFN